MTAATPESTPGPWGYDHGFQLRTLATGKFDVTEVLQPDAHFVIKATDSLSAQADLGNSVAWATWARGQQPTSFQTPNTIAKLAITDRGRLVTPIAHIDWVDGEHPAEKDLELLLPKYSDIIHELDSMEVRWTGDASAWIRQKLKAARLVVLNHVADKMLATGIEDLLGSDVLDKIQPGVVHGDLAPKNTVIDTDDRPWLLDAEFGTHGNRPSFAVPRTRDAAYLLHLLYCQYEQPWTGQALLTELESRFGDDTSWEQEFWLATLERTMTMYKLFVVDQPEGQGIDRRRLNPKPYVDLLNVTVDHLRS